MTKNLAFTLDLEADHAGIGDTYHIFSQPEQIDEILALLQSYGVKLTVFVVGQVIERFPEVIDRFARAGVEFELHSYSHNLLEPDSAREIEQGMAAYHQFFGMLPRGYRAPQGIITTAGIARLASYGFSYDASIFPSYFPKPWRYLLKPREIHWHRDYPIVEIPFTAITPFRLTLSLSYLKLLGYASYRTMFQTCGLPSFVCFDSHLHDFISPNPSYRALPWVWQRIYGRHRHQGLAICRQFLEDVITRGYRFQFMSEALATFKSEVPVPPSLLAPRLNLGSVKE